jgi:hypothetical protein
VIFPFQTVRVRRPAPSANYRLDRSRPVFSLGVARPDGGGRVFDNVLADTGADDVILSTRTAADAHIDLSAAPTIHVQAATGRLFVVKYAEVELTLYAALDHFVRWRAVVGFGPLAQGAFGFTGGLQFFHANFDHTAGRFSLIPRVNLPATETRFPN